MSAFGQQATAAFDRATERARAILKPGDRLLIANCGGRSTVTFVGWVDHRGVPDPVGRCIASKTLDDLLAWNVSKVNGQPANFRDPIGVAAVDADVAGIDAERAHRRAIAIQQTRNGFRLVKALASTAANQGEG